eukprot:NODE_172_length_15988_cov_0.603940.p12 type:complete len:103 gc:universal NODE_172_length_15988_cov_0.603940:4943-5251(+)
MFAQFLLVSAVKQSPLDIDYYGADKSVRPIVIKYAISREIAGSTGRSFFGTSYRPKIFRLSEGPLRPRAAIQIPVREMTAAHLLKTPHSSKLRARARFRPAP